MGSAESSLHTLAAEGRIDLLAAWLEGPATNVDSRDMEGYTALHRACLAGKAEAALFLIRHGASIEANDVLGNRPLILAAMNGHTALVQLLLDLGAQPEVTNCRGQDALVLAAINERATTARILRDHVIRLRESNNAASARHAGVTLSDLPADRPPVFFTGHLSKPASAIPDFLGDRALAEEMKRSIPLTTFEGWLKQIDASELSPIGQLALDRAFPLFLSLTDFGESSAHSALTRRGYGVTSFQRAPRARRFAGDHTLPRGRYFTVCRDEKGDDSGTLIGELYAYCQPRKAGIIALVDSTNEQSMKTVEESGNWNLPRLQTPFIGVLFSPSDQGANPFAKLCGVDWPNVLSVLLPVSITRICLEGVLDLRQPRTADWFAYYFSRLVVDLKSDVRSDVREERRWRQCCPNRPKLDSIREMLPTLLTQEPGGGVFCQMVGSWLRQNQVNALIYPSVRSDPRVETLDGRLVDCTSWNLVDYRGAEAPHLPFFVDVSDHWAEKIRVGVGLGSVWSERKSQVAVRDVPERDPYEAVQVDYVDQGPRAGSWRAKGIIAVKLAILAAQQTAYVHAGENKEFELGWVDELPIESDVKDWIKLFVTHNYAECVRRGISLLPTIRSFEILQMFLTSLQRMGEAPAGGGWTAAEVLEQLGPQVLAHHEHDQELHRLLGITLGVRDPNEALALEQDRTARCRIHYYAAARLISAGLHREALPHLDACIDEPGNCNEAHLALAHREYDYRAGFGPD